MEKKKKSFKYRAVVITGGSSGIGESFLASIINLDQNVLICNLSRQKPKIEIENIRFNHFACDLSKSENIEAVVPQVIDLLDKNEPEGPVLLINNSGFGSYGEFQEMELSRQLEMVAVNVSAVVHLAGLLLPLMLRRGGAVVNVASTAAFQPTPYMATYGGTKAFLLNWSLALGEDLKETGVRVLAVCPGPTETNFFKLAGSDAGSNYRQSPEEVVDLTWKALAAGKSFVVTGWVNRLLACIVRFIPLSWLTKISREVLKQFRMQGRKR